MSNRRHAGGRTTPKGTRPLAQVHHLRPRNDDPPLMVEARRTLREDHPLALLQLASGLIEATTERSTDVLRRRPQPRPSVNDLVDSFVGAGDPSMAALAAAVGVLHPHAAVRDRVAKRLAAASELTLRWPRWMTGLGDIAAFEAAAHVDILDDGVNLLVSWRWPDHQAATAIIYVDHNMGTIVKDGFVVPDDLARLQRVYERIGADAPDAVAFDLADARARIEEGIRTGLQILPPIENDTWPMCRPIVQWLCRHLPAGGKGFEFRELTAGKRTKLVNEFIRSPEATQCAVPMHLLRNVADLLFMFAASTATGDPLRWSPVSIEIVLADWIPRKVYGFTAREVALVPPALAAIVGYSHRLRGIPPARTEDALRAIERWTPNLLAATVDEFDSDFDDDEDDGWISDHSSRDNPFEGLEGDDFMRKAAELAFARLVQTVGSEQALATLTADPLPDTAFDPTNIDDNLRHLAMEVAALMDQWAVDCYDGEIRTIARARLSAALREDPGLLTRSPRHDAVAAAALYDAVMSAQRRAGSRTFAGVGWAVTTQKQLAQRTGIPATMISARASTINGAVWRSSFDQAQWLHSLERGALVETRELLDEWHRAHPLPD